MECAVHNCRLDAVLYIGEKMVCRKHHARWKRTQTLADPIVHRKARTVGLTILGQNLLALRAQRKLKVDNLADLCGVDRNLIWRLSFHKSFQISSLEKVAKGLNVEPWTLLCPNYYKMPEESADALD